MASVSWQSYTTERCSGRVAVVDGYLVSEADGYLDHGLATLMITMTEEVFARGDSLGAFHVWNSTLYDSAFRASWMACMRKWGTKYFRDLHIYVPQGLSRMGLSVAAALRIGDIIVYKSREALLLERSRILGF